MGRYWQVAAGSSERDYSEEFLKFGMAFVGTDTEKMNMVEEGDIVILKSGVTMIRAAGRVVRRDGKVGGDGDKKWLCDFDGWNLPAYCYVDWCEGNVPATGLARGTMREVHIQALRDAAEKIIEDKTGPRDPEPEPESTKGVTDDELISFLIEQGLRVSQADELTKTISRIRRLADYYYNCGVRWEDVREHEVRTFLVVPLLLALGWAEQQLKIELPCGGRKSVDIAGFSRRYTGSNTEKCTMIVETKGFSSGLTYAEDQAKRYSEYFPSCRLVVVTNGYCYKTYIKDGSESFGKDPSAYLNLRDPQDGYPINPKNVKGATEAIKWLLPSYVNDEANEAT